VILRSHLKQLCEENRRRNIPEITGWLQVLEGNKEWILGQDQNEGKLRLVGSTQALMHL
jgi:hypothetical protein